MKDVFQAHMIAAFYDPKTNTLLLFVVYLESVFFCATKTVEYHLVQIISLSLNKQ